MQRAEGWHPAPRRCPGHSPVVPHPFPRDGPGSQHPQNSSLEAAETEPPPATPAPQGPPGLVSLCSLVVALQSPALSPQAPPQPRGPPCPHIPQLSRLKNPAGGWERLAALPRRFSFIKHKAGGGFSQAVGTAESLFSAASGRKMEEGRETGWPLPLFGF